MRIVGLLLVLAGAVTLGYPGVTYTAPDATQWSDGLATPDAENRVWGLPLVGGTAIVAGVLLAAPRRRGA